MKYNKPSKVTGSNRTVNFEGAQAYKMDARTELYTRVLTSLMSEDKFYESGKDSDSKLISLARTLSKTDPKFVAGLAIIARKKFYLRSVPQVLAIELSMVHKGDSLVSRLIPQIVERPDDMTEMLSYFGKYGKPPKPLAKLPKQVKLGLSLAFPKFNAYQLAKYNRDTGVKLRDVLFLCHAKPASEEQDKVWKQLIDGTLPSPDTWEVNLTQAGQKGEDKKATWEETIPKMGYMAILRNLRNFVKNEIDPELYTSTLIDSEKILKSKQLPFRFFSAYQELEKVGAPTAVMDAVGLAMEGSVRNVPAIEGKTLICCDNSGSMDSSISGKSTVKCRDIANLLGAIGHKRFSDCDVGVFSDTWKPVGLSKLNSILANKTILGKGVVPSSTNTHLIFEWLTKNKKVYDRIIILSDMQAWDSTSMCTGVQTSYAAYKKAIGSDPFIYSIDLAGYGTSDIDPRNPKVRKLAGWSEKVLSYIQAAEEDPKSIFSEIEKAALLT